MNGGVLETGTVMGEGKTPLKFIPNPLYYQGDGFDIMRDNFLNQDVQIYPGDSRKKFGPIIDINSVGVTFRITKSDCDQYLVNDIRFISYSHNLTFRKV